MIDDCFFADLYILIDIGIEKGQSSLPLQIQPHLDLWVLSSWSMFKGGQAFCITASKSVVPIYHLWSGPWLGPRVQAGY